MDQERSSHFGEDPNHRAKKGNLFRSHCQRGSALSKGPCSIPLILCNQPVSIDIATVATQSLHAVSNGNGGTLAEFT